MISTKRYTLYKSTSLPYRIKNNLFSYIVPNYEYVALDQFKEKYVAITENEINQCFNTNENVQTLICKQTFPILTAISTKTCEINLLRKQNITNECDIRISNLTSELWIKLRQPNKYIYVFPEKELMFIKCAEMNENNFYINTGIISYGEDCQIKTNNVEIQAFKTLTSEIITNFIPSVKLTINVSYEIENMTLLNGFEIPLINIPQIVNFGEKYKLEDISKSFSELKILEQQLTKETTPFHLKGNINFLSKFSFIIAIITLIIAIKLLYRCWLKYDRRRKFAKTDLTKEIIICSTPNIPLSSTSLQTQKIYPKINPVRPEQNIPLQPMPVPRVPSYSIIDTDV